MKKIIMMALAVALNRITEYAGKLFTSDGEQVALSLNSDWNEKYDGVW